MTNPKIFRVFLLMLVFFEFNTAFAHVGSIGIQPLSQIAAENATLALHNSASIKAFPLVLGLKGEDTEWVRVDLEYPNPSENDWVGIFSPAKFM